MQQTRTSVTDEQSMLDMRTTSALRAHRALVGVMLFMQLYAGEALYVMQRAGSASALALMATVLFTLPVFALLRRQTRACGAPALDAALGGLWPIAAVLILLCLCLDMAGLLLLISDLCVHVLLPVQNNGLYVPIIVSLVTLAALWSGDRYGTARYVYLIRLFLLAVVVVCLLSVARYAQVGHLFPYLGQSAQITGRGTLWLCGAGWVCLLLLLPPEMERLTPDRTGARGLATLCGAYGAVLALMLTLNLTQPIYTFSRRLSYSERALLVMESYWAVPFWSLMQIVLLFAILGALSGCAQLALRVAPKWKGRRHPLLCLIPLVPSCVAVSVFPEWSERALIVAAPARCAALLLPVVLLLFKKAPRTVQKEESPA